MRVSAEKKDMPSFQFNDFEAYAAALNDVDVRVMLPRLDIPFWEVGALPAGRVHLQQGLERSGIIAEGSTSHDDVMLFIPISGPQSCNGVDMGDSSVLVVPPRSEFFICSQLEHAWCSLRVPGVVASEFLGVDMQPGAQWPGSRVVKSGKGQLDCVRRLVAEALVAGAADPSLFQNPACQASLEADIIQACHRVFSSRQEPAPGPGRHLLDRGRIIRLLRDEIHAREKDCPLVPTLARNAEVSERTLRSAFLEYFGVSPQKYISLHRLNMARQALMFADLELTKVATIAKKYGFWHLGRFSSQYRESFGELPSETLGKAQAGR